MLFIRGPGCSRGFDLVMNHPVKKEILRNHKKAEGRRTSVVVRACCQKLFTGSG